MLVINEKRVEIYDLNNHPLRKYFGIIYNDEAQELRDCINHEFTKIEGEW